MEASYTRRAASLTSIGRSSTTCRPRVSPCFRCIVISFVILREYAAFFPFLLSDQCSPAPAGGQFFLVLISRSRSATRAGLVYLAPTHCTLRSHSQRLNRSLARVRALSTTLLSSYRPSGYRTSRFIWRKNVEHCDVCEATPGRPSFDGMDQTAAKVKTPLRVIGMLDPEPSRGPALVKDSQC